MWQNMFSPKEEGSTGNMFESFSYEALISWDEYNNLQKAYEYSWLQRAWSAVSGFVQGGTWSARYYLFYAIPGTSVSWIDIRGEVESEEEAEKPDQGGGVFELEVTEKLEDVKVVYDGLWDSGMQIIGTVPGLIKDGVNNIKAGSNFFKKYGGIIAVLAVGVAGVYIYFKIKNNK